MSDCVTKIAELFSDMPKREVSAIVKEMEKAKSRYFKESDGPTRAGFQERVQKFMQEYRRDNIAAQKEAIHNIQTRQKILDVVLQDAFKNDPHKGLQAYMSAGEARMGKGTSSSPELMSQHYAREWVISMVQAVKESGLEDAIKKGEIELPLAQAMFSLSNKEAMPSVIHPSIQTLAKRLHAVNQDILKTLQNSGSSVRELMGYITKQTHNADRLTEVKFDKWFEDIMPRLDKDKSFASFENDVEIRQHMQEVYNKIVTGTYDAPKANEGSSDTFMTVNGASANLAQKTARGRGLHFKDAAAWVEYNQSYGSKNVVESMLSSAFKQADNASMLHYFGTNPEAMYQSIKSRIKDQLTPDMAKKFEAQEKMLDKKWATIKGVSDRPGITSMAKIAKHATDLAAASKLGGSLLTAVPGDLATTLVRERSSTGQNVFGGSLDLVTSYADSFKNPNERIQAMIEAENTMREYMGGMLGTISTPGTVSKLAMGVNKYGGMQRHTVVMRELAARRVQKSLGKVADLKFEELNPRMQADLSRHGVDNHDWELMRRGIEESNGKKHVTPEGIKGVDAELSDALAENALLSTGGGQIKLTQTQLNKWKFGVEVKLATLMADHSNAASTTAGTREKSIIMGANSNDEVEGMIRRVAGQFKQVPLMNFNETKRMLLANPKTQPTSIRDAFSFQDRKNGNYKLKGDFAGLGYRIGMLTVAGYMTGVFSDLAKGKKPKDPTDPSAIGEAMVRGGAGGLYADLLLSKYSTDAGGLAKSIVGPTFGQVGDLYDMAKSDDKRKGPTATKFLNIGINNIPFQNLFYTRAAIDHFILNGVKESLAPGAAYKQEHGSASHPKNDEYLIDALKPTNSVGVK